MQEFYQNRSAELLSEAIELTAPAERVRFWQNVQLDGALEALRATSKYKDLEKKLGTPVK